jgi:hypothetical protein
MRQSADPRDRVISELQERLALGTERLYAFTHRIDELTEQLRAKGPFLCLGLPESDPMRPPSPVSAKEHQQLLREWDQSLASIRTAPQPQRGGKQGEGEDN